MFREKARHWGFTAAALLLIPACTHAGREAPKQAGAPETVSTPDRPGKSGKVASRYSSATSTSSGSSSGCMPAEARELLYTAWRAELPGLRSAMETGTAEGNEKTLYNAQIFVNPILWAAHVCRDVGLLSDLADYIGIAFSHLREYEGAPTWIGAQGKPLEILNTSQFLYLASSAAHFMAAIPEGDRTEAIRNYLKITSPVLLQHYEHWILGEPEFSVKSWGCTGGGSKGKVRNKQRYFNHEQFLKLKLKKELRVAPGEPLYCDAVADRDMWILTGLVELLGAGLKDPTLLPPKTADRFTSYIDVGTKLIRSRLQPTALKDRAGQPVAGLIMDSGMWAHHGMNAYSGYFGAEYPSTSQKATAANVTWDLGHASRYVYVFETLFDNKEVTQQDFPTLEQMKALANQFAYGVFNGDYARPLFANYFDGNNGWYRVGYMNRPNFGYGPWMLSGRAITDGFGFLARFNPEIARIDSVLYDLLKTEKPDARRHFEKYFSTANGRPNLRLVQFLPVLVRRKTP